MGPEGEVPGVDESWRVGFLIGTRRAGRYGIQRTSDDSKRASPVPAWFGGLHPTHDRNARNVPIVGSLKSEAARRLASSTL